MVSRQLLLLRRLRDNALLQIAPATHTTHAATTTTVRVGLLPLSLLEQIFQQNAFLKKKRVEIFKIIKNFVHNLAAPAPAANGGNKRLV